MKRELTKEEYQKKIELCEKLGAKWFQQVVFKVEQLKFNVLKKYFPNCTEKYDKSCDKKCRKALKKAKTEEERKLIIMHYREQKMLFRKEMNREQNRNYHFDRKRPSDTLRYLKWNKSVHKNGLITNMISISILTGIALVGIPAAIPFIALETVSAFINFQCINTQNYNIYRLEKIGAKLREKEEKQAIKSEAEYGDAAVTINSVMQEKSKTDKPTELPSMNEIIGSMNKEQLKQFRIMINKEQQERMQISQDKKGGYKNGN